MAHCAHIAIGTSENRMVGEKRINNRLVEILCMCAVDETAHRLYLIAAVAVQSAVVIACAGIVVRMDVSVPPTAESLVG